jgi:late competence protein required for DNA uptake (superfamily II DNA/RNA helicase)
VDVCNEIFLRFCGAFPQEKISLFHGQERKDNGDIFVVCTVHQLLRYHEYFDLVIIDEVDAFPYAEDPLLHRTVERAKRKDGKRVFLSATPDEKLKKVSRLPVPFTCQISSPWVTCSTSALLLALRERSVCGAPFKENLE